MSLGSPSAWPCTDKNCIQTGVPLHTRIFRVSPGPSGVCRGVRSWGIRDAGSRPWSAERRPGHLLEEMLDVRSGVKWVEVIFELQA